MARPMPTVYRYNDDMSFRELNQLSKLVHERRGELERKWFEYFA